MEIKEIWNRLFKMNDGQVGPTLNTVNERYHQAVSNLTDLVKQKQAADESFEKSIVTTHDSMSQQFVAKRRELFEDRWLQDILKATDEMTEAKRERNDIIETLTNFKYIHHIHHAKTGLYRKNLPQIIDEDQFIVNCTRKFGVTREKVKISHLKPSQQDVSIDKVIDIYGQKSYEGKMYFVDINYHLLDGHHNWAAQLESDESEAIVFRVHADVFRVIDCAEDLQKDYVKEELDGSIVKALERRVFLSNEIQDLISKSLSEEEKSQLAQHLSKFICIPIPNKNGEMSDFYILNS